MTQLNRVLTLQTLNLTNYTSGGSDGKLKQRYYLDCSTKNKAIFSDREEEEERRCARPKGALGKLVPSLLSRSQGKKEV